MKEECNCTNFNGCVKKWAQEKGVKPALDRNKDEIALMANINKKHFKEIGWEEFFWRSDNENPKFRAGNIWKILLIVGAVIAMALIGKYRRKFVR